MLNPSSSSTAAGGISSPSIAVGIGADERPAKQRRVEVLEHDTRAEQKKKQPKIASTDLRGITGFTSKQRSYLVRTGFTTTQEVLFLPPQSLSERLKISSEETKSYISAITSQRSQKWMNLGSVASQLGLNSENTQDVKDTVGVLSTGDTGLDELLGGGVVPGTLTEIAGEASSGKTALSLQLALHVQLPLAEDGLAGSCAYLSSEGNFPSTRLVDIARTICNDNADEVAKMTDNVHLIHCAEVEELLHAVRYSLPALVERLDAQGGGEEEDVNETQVEHATPLKKPVKLVIVDSIAAPFRGSEASGPVDATVSASSYSNSYAERNAQLHEIATTLHTLARRHSLCVILVNQVSDVFSSSSSDYHNANSSQQAMMSSISHEDGGIPLDYRNYSTVSRYFSGEDAGNGGKMAVFGLPWSNLIQTRVMLSRTGRRQHKGLDIVAVEADGYDDQDNEIMGEVQTEEIRRANLVFSPFSDRGYTDYVLRQGGLVSIGEYIKQPRVVASSGKGKGRDNGDMDDNEGMEDDEEALWEGFGTDVEPVDG